jgi:hypothetical protein
VFAAALVEYVWKVPTTGARAASAAYQDTTGAFGSCTCTTS